MNFSCGELLVRHVLCSLRFAVGHLWELVVGDRLDLGGSLSECSVSNARRPLTAQSCCCPNCRGMPCKQFVTTLPAIALKWRKGCPAIVRGRFVSAPRICEGAESCLDCENETAAILAQAAHKDWP